MRVHCRHIAAGAILLVFVLAGSTALGGVTAYWSFDSDFTSAGSRTGMDGTAVNEGGTVSIATGLGEYKFGGGALKIDDAPGGADGAARTALLINGSFVDATWPISNPATDIPIVTISGWYKIADVGGDGSDGWNYLWETDPAYSASASVRTDDSGGAVKQNPRWAVSCGAGNFNDTTGPDYNHGDWNHIVTVFNPVTKRAKFYHNGVLRDYRAIPEEYLTSLNESATTYIGSSRLTYDNRNFDGYMDEIAVFDHEPTPEVIQGLYDGTYTPATAPSDEATALTPNVHAGWTIDNTIEFYKPHGLAINPTDGKLHVVRRWNANAGEGGVYAIESDGSATEILSSVYRPYGLAIDSSGNIFYSEDYGTGTNDPTPAAANGEIRKVIGDPPFRTGELWVTDMNGDGTDNDPGAMVILPDDFDGGPGATVFAGDALVADRGNGSYERIYVWSTSSAEGEWTLHDDTDKADGAGSVLYDPRCMAASDSAIYVTDAPADTIYLVSPVDGSLTAVTTSTPIEDPTSIAVDPLTDDLYVIVDYEDVPGSTLVKIDPDTGTVTTVVDTLTDIDKEPTILQAPQMLFSDDGQHLYFIQPETDIIYDLLRSQVSVPGDTDNDGDVDQDDASVLATNWGSSTTLGAEAGDFNGDTVVDMLDASILAANWTGTQEGGAAVPEPSALAALLGMAVALLWRRR